MRISTLLTSLLLLVPFFSSAGHFTPVFTDLYESMQIYVVSADLNGVNLEAGDEIGIFDGDLCTGKATLFEPLGVFDDEVSLTISVSAYENSENKGHVIGHGLTFKIWDTSKQREISSVSAEFLNTELKVISSVVFESGESAWVKLSTSAINQVPVANAGNDLVANENTSVVLDGSSSSDKDGDVLSYYWTSLDGLTIKSPERSKAEVKLPLLSADKKYRFVLTVNDGVLNSSDTLAVLVKDAIHPPLANAGKDFEVSEGAKARLEGSVITDVPNVKLKVKWDVPAGFEVRNPEQLITSFTAPLVEANTKFQFVLHISDQLHAEVTDTLYVLVNKNNQAPVAENMQYEIKEDQSCSFVLKAKDDNDPIFELRYEIMEKPHHAQSFNLNQSRINYTPETNFSGKDSLKFRVQDKRGLWSAPAWIVLQVLPVNDAPLALYSEVDAGQINNVTVDFKNFISDVETLPAGLSVHFWLFSSQGKPVGVLGGNLSDQGANVYTYSNSQPVTNSDYLIYKVSDGERYSAAEVVKISNLPSKKSAQMSSDLLALSDTFDVNFGEKLNLEFLGVYNKYPFSQLNCKIETYPKNGTLNKFAFGSYNGNVLTSYKSEYTPTENKNLSDKILFSYSDGTGNKAQGEIFIRIKAQNVTPILTAIGPQTVRMNHKGQIPLNCIDLDTDPNLLKWEVNGLNSSFLTSNVITDNGMSILELSPAANYEGTNIVSLKVTDDTGLSSETQFEFTVMNDFIPQFISTPVTVMQENDVYQYQVVTTDEDQVDQVYLTAQSLPAWLAFSVNDSIATISGKLPVDHSGMEDYNIEVLATDSVIYTPVSQLYTLHVNYAPKFISEPKETVEMGYEYQYEVKVTDLNANDTIVISSENLPDWLTLTDNGDGTATIKGVLDKKEELKGTHLNFSIQAKDNNGSPEVNQEINLTIDYKTKSSLWSIAQIEVYPNPTAGELFVQFDQMPENGTVIQVFDLAGKKQLEKTVTSSFESLSLAGMRPGCYFVKIWADGNQLEIWKIILK